MNNKIKIGLLLLGISLGCIMFFLKWNPKKEQVPIWSQYIAQDKEIDSLLKSNSSLAEIKIDSLYKESIQNKDTLKLAYVYYHKIVMNRKKIELDSISFF
ncbi:hypothetical protein [Myroides indicus]|uniref:Uncharacterized protein n=1 Tax=Myroides indicus TaxID=1323422 RepID=A0A4R7F3W9_9FLAO|nr:hypothetical protein [Myroides indicus]TDS64291.1 hypothetical protein C8P70_1047 [Myroides indicus]